MNCLFVIDVQNGFVTEETKAVIPEILRTMETFPKELVLASRFVNEAGSAFTGILKWYGMQEEKETELYEGIKERAGFTAVKYGYSACTPEVLGYLWEHRVTDVYLTGMDTDCCVLATAVDLFENHIRPVVLANCCASTGGKRAHEAGLLALERLIGKEQIVR